MLVRPYIVIPNLIIQPTWGGKYISQFKNIASKEIVANNIGQSYELFEYSKLSNKFDTKNNPTLEIGDPDNPQDSKLLGVDKPIAIQSLINQNPQAILGKNTQKIYSNKMGVLIKFTQAKGNSYQLHVKKDNSIWKTKPESWLFMESGFITLGLNTDLDINAYRKSCISILKSSKKLSQAVLSGEIPLQKAREEIAKFLKNENIVRFVNHLKVKKDQAIDLSKCGIHHSWEEDEASYPRGNIVYEVQKNVYDPVSTIRSFDKGKFKEDGSIRELQIEDYFKFINKKEEDNLPEKYLTNGTLVDVAKNYKIKKIFDSKYYQMHQIELNGVLNNNHTLTSDSFHHLFSKKGEFILSYNSTNLNISRGYSVFIPASIGSYSIISKGKSEILKTFV